MWFRSPVRRRRLRFMARSNAMRVPGGGEGFHAHFASSRADVRQAWGDGRQALIDHMLAQLAVVEVPPMAR
jgi:hypothetical protein